MKKNRVLVVLSLIVFIGLFSQNIYANSYNNGKVTIDESFISGSLGDEIETVQRAVYNITTLTITEGVINADDFEWINDNLEYLEIFEIIENAKVHSTTDSPVDTQDDIVPKEAFKSNRTLQEVTISSATTIGNSAFLGCEDITRVNFPEVETINSSAFEECSNLESLDLPEAISIELAAFAYCEELTSVSLPKVTSIGRYAFLECPITSVNLPEVTNVELAAFYDCRELTSVSIPKATNIESYAFESCEELISVSLPMATSIGSAAFFDCEKLTSVDLPKITSIGSGAFARCSSLKSIELPEATEIGGYAFEKCSSLESIKLPKVTGVGCGTFEDCNSLNSIELLEITEIESDLFKNCEALTSVSIPNVETIGSGAFLGCNSLEHIELLEATEIGSYAFKECYGLVSVNLPKVTSVGEFAFGYCSSLERIELPEVTTIDRRALQNSYITSVSLPKVITIGEYAFKNCDGLTSVSFPEAETVDEEAFIACDSLKSIELPEVTEIEDGVFKDCEELISVSLPKVTTIGWLAFANCTGLESIELPEVTEIGSYAFQSADSLASVNIPVVTSIGDYAFYDCISLNSLTLGENIPTIETHTFSNISSDSPTVYVPVGSGTSYEEDKGDGDGKDEEWYGFIIYEISDDATLSSLAISSGTLNPEFNSSIIIYSVDVSNDIASIDVTPTTNDSNASVAVEVYGVTSGESVEVPLSVGENEINIVVTAEDGSTTVETIVTVIRAKSSNSSRGTDTEDDSMIKQLKKEDMVEVAVEDNETISEEVFETLKEEGGKLVIDGDWYQWEFDGQSEVEEEVNADFEPSIEVIDKDEVDIELDDDKGFIIKTKYEGKLPIKAKLKFKVDKFAKDQTVYLYYYNETTGKLELSGTAVNEDGQAEFEITHCSIYTISNKPAFKEGYENIAYVSGYDDDTFRPNKSLSRAEAAVMLSRLLESEGIQGASEFSDTDMWAEDEIVILSELDVISGYSDDTFKPNKDITRGELAVIMSKVLGLDINEDKEGFTDTEDHWAENAIIALREAGIVNGYSDGSFKPDDVVTRVEAIAMINRAFERAGDETKVYDNPFGDIDNKHWAFYLIMNAAGQ